MTEAAASQQICKLGVVPIRTNREMIRADEADLVHKSETGKFTVVAHEVLNAKHHEREFAKLPRLARHCDKSPRPKRYNSSNARWFLTFIVPWI